MQLETRNQSATRRGSPLGRILLSLLVLCGTARGDDNVFLQHTPRPEPVTAPSVDQIHVAITRGVDFLLAEQNANGSWGSATSTKGLNIYAPLPGAHHAFRSGVTGLAVSALLRSRDQRPDVHSAISRGEAWLLQHLPAVKRATPDTVYNVWGHAYGIAALADLIMLDGADDVRNESRRALIRNQIKLLARYQAIDLGWGYLDFGAQTQRPNTTSTCFTTATVLIALGQARDAGADVPPSLVDDAITSIHRSQKPDFSYYYSYNGPTKHQPMRSINRPGRKSGSLAGLQPGAQAVGRSADHRSGIGSLAKSFVRPQSLAGYRAEAAHPT